MFRSGYKVGVVYERYEMRMSRIKDGGGYKLSGDWLEIFMSIPTSLPWIPCAHERTHTHTSTSTSKAASAVGITSAHERTSAFNLPSTDSDEFQKQYAIDNGTTLAMYPKYMLFAIVIFMWSFHMDFPTISNGFQSFQNGNIPESLGGIVIVVVIVVDVDDGGGGVVVDRTFVVL